MSKVLPREEFHSRRREMLTCPSRLKSDQSPPPGRKTFNLSKLYLTWPSGFTQRDGSRRVPALSYWHSLRWLAA